MHPFYTNLYYTPSHPMFIDTNIAIAEKSSWSFPFSSVVHCFTDQSSSTIISDRDLSNWHQWKGSYPVFTELYSDPAPLIKFYPAAAATGRSYYYQANIRVADDHLGGMSSYFPWSIDLLCLCTCKLSGSPQCVLFFINGMQFIFCEKALIRMQGINTTTSQKT
jgi:hypothetical protein